MGRCHVSSQKFHAKQHQLIDSILEFDCLVFAPPIKRFSFVWTMVTTVFLYNRQFHSNTHTYTMHCDQWLLTWIQINTTDTHRCYLEHGTYGETQKKCTKCISLDIRIQMGEWIVSGGRSQPTRDTIFRCTNQPGHEWTNERNKKHAN